MSQSQVYLFSDSSGEAEWKGASVKGVGEEVDDGLLLPLDSDDDAHQGALNGRANESRRTIDCKSCNTLLRFKFSARPPRA
jgi:hypothetical protein